MRAHVEAEEDEDAVAGDHHVARGLAAGERRGPTPAPHGQLDHVQGGVLAGAGRHLPSDPRSHLLGLGALALPARVDAGHATLALALRLRGRSLQSRHIVTCGYAQSVSNYTEKKFGKRNFVFRDEEMTPVIPSLFDIVS